MKVLGGGNCNQGLWNPNWQDMDLQSFVLKSESSLFQVNFELIMLWRAMRVLLIFLATDQAKGWFLY